MTLITGSALYAFGKCRRMERDVCSVCIDTHSWRMKAKNEKANWRVQIVNSRSATPASPVAPL